MGLRAKSEKGVVERASKVRRFRRLTGTNELQRPLGVADGGRCGVGGVREGVVQEPVTSILAGSYFASCLLPNCQANTDNFLGMGWGGSLPTP